MTGWESAVAKEMNVKVKRGVFQFAYSDKYPPCVAHIPLEEQKNDRHGVLNRGSGDWIANRRGRHYGPNCRVRDEVRKGWKGDVKRPFNVADLG